MLERKRNFLIGTNKTIKMDPLFKKLNFKGHYPIIVLNAPASFQSAMESMKELTTFQFDTNSVKEIEFVIAFAQKQDELHKVMTEVGPKLTGDAVVWFCYPKKSSKTYRCDFDRDTGWEIMGTYGLEPVRQVAIDKDWSALRFRKVEFIKKITRSKKMALTAEARKRTSHKG